MGRVSITLDSGKKVGAVVCGEWIGRIGEEKNRRVFGQEADGRCNVFFFSSSRQHTKFALVSWARRCV